MPEDPLQAIFERRENVKLLESEQIIYHFKARDLEIPLI